MIENEVLISVIIPVYNVSFYLTKCLDSVCNQSYVNYEVLLVDDGSKDDSGKICDEYAIANPKIRVFHKENGGVSSARNVGLRNSKGAFVTFVDGDDTIDSEYLKTMINGFFNYDVDFVRVVFSREGNVLGRSKDFKLGGERVVGSSELTDLKTIAYAGGILIRKSCINNIFFDEKIHYGEDKLFLVSAYLQSKTKKILLIDKPLYNYIERPNSSSGKTFSTKIFSIKNAADKIENMLSFDSKLHSLALDNKRTFYFLLYKKLIDCTKYSVYRIEKKDLKKEILFLRKIGFYPKNRNGNVVEFCYLYNMRFLVSFFVFFKNKWTKIKKR